MPRDGWKDVTGSSVLIRDGKCVAEIYRYRSYQWFVLVCDRQIGSASTVRDGKAMAEAWLARESK